MAAITTPGTASKAVQRAPGAVTLRVIAALLGYPDTWQRDNLTEMRSLLRHDDVLKSSRLAEIEALITTLQSGDPLVIEAAYVEMFDRGRATSLHLFEHVHGDSRERGPAMIDLGQTYQSAGLVLNENELPDYLPALLEFVSTQPAREARAFLSEIAHILKAIFGALRERESAYASLLGALLEMAGQKAEAVASAPEQPLDESWAEPVVFDGCSTEGQAKPGQPQPIHIVRKNTNAQGAMR
ncbi:nitrate reductase molybdenum cofactor assembly chaperone [Caenimonas sp. SL110]|uniref:nitrate reductase molybdenum cofactor assembly chaperone n=1 Tax=Caenimonas sp. SL110 TaxID=1450524 RepID=UPI0006545BF1|nr:nitrate reductase molybdenum cofactor assembly chaperone [Caenimonas sp. SL110]